LQQFGVAPIAARKSKRAEEPGHPVVEDGDIFPASLLAKGAGEPAFAHAARSSGILPGIRVRAGVFTIRIILAKGRRSLSFAGSVFKVPTYLWFTSSMERWRIFHAG